MAAFSIDSSAGRLDVRFGWDGWVAVTGPQRADGAQAARRIVEYEDELAELLESFGLPRKEADRAAHSLWEQAERPAEEEPEPEPRRPLSGLAWLGAGIAVAVAVLAVTVSVF